MEAPTKTNSKKVSFDINKEEIFSTGLNNTIFINNYIIQHFLHPDYVLFDWEFFSSELEFE